MTSSESILNAIKIIYTVVWTFFVSCILAIWFFAWQAEYLYAVLSIGVVLVEVVVLALNRWRCPLGSVAARYTGDRRADFERIAKPIAMGLPAVDRILPCSHLARRPSATCRASGE
jgi:hypothetical protein